MEDPLSIQNKRHHRAVVFGVHPQHHSLPKTENSSMAVLPHPRQLLSLGWRSYLLLDMQRAKHATTGTPLVLDAATTKKINIHQRIQHECIRAWLMAALAMCPAQKKVQFHPKAFLMTISPALLPAGVTVAVNGPYQAALVTPGSEQGTKVPSGTHVLYPANMAFILRPSMKDRPNASNNSIHGMVWDRTCFKRAARKTAQNMQLLQLALGRPAIRKSNRNTTQTHKRKVMIQQENKCSRCSFCDLALLALQPLHSQQVLGRHEWAV